MTEGGEDVHDIKTVSKEIAVAVAPIVLTVVVLHFTLVPLDSATLTRFLLGSLMVYVGLVLFLVGANLGIIPLGERIGGSLGGRGSFALLLVFAFILGLAVTVAEPNLRVLALLVDEVSGGSIGPTALIVAVGMGVGIFTLLNMVRVALQIPLVYILLAAYAIVLVLSTQVSPEFLAVGFDSGGVITGPLTVPFVLALSIGVGAVLGARDRMAASFGMLALAAVGPILGVLVLGMIYG